MSWENWEQTRSRWEYLTNCTWISLISTTIAWIGNSKALSETFVTPSDNQHLYSHSEQQYNRHQTGPTSYWRIYFCPSAWSLNFKIQGKYLFYWDYFRPPLKPRNILWATHSYSVAVVILFVMSWKLIKFTIEEQQEDIVLLAIIFFYQHLLCSTIFIFLINNYY